MKSLGNLKQLIWVQLGVDNGCSSIEKLSHLRHLLKVIDVWTAGDATTMGAKAFKLNMITVEVE
ncbi:hypothetical protein TIFTF001_038045 [Ficus carica]|uniref:Uncharacterized protein n=1 Tax=Ficus carica TaxID=3494 RepID=A0AA88JDC6_FICCA|nr:hypothetical protein TIFTF001_038045 [Ficus carica]